MKIPSLFALFTALLALLSSPYSLAACPAILDHEMKRLHSSETMDLCDEFAGRPMLIVNTASHCGFTPQFESLEAMHLRYRDKGVGFLGVASDSFNQESATEKGAAEVCYINYGVTFSMAAPVPVRGTDAHPLFRALAAQSRPPKWNFNKYVLDRSGNVAAVFDSAIAPDDRAITDLLDRLVAEG